jgi:hypothetical protein
MEPFRHSGFQNMKNREMEMADLVKDIRHLLTAMSILFFTGVALVGSVIVIGAPLCYFGEFYLKFWGF